MDVKTYLYKVYDSSGSTLITTWNDVVSELSFSQEINNGAVQTTITLARPYNNFGEGIDIKFNNQVKIYVVDKEAPDGRLIFTGYIADYSVIISNQEHIEVVVFGYGSELNYFVLESGYSLYLNLQNGFNVQIPFGQNGGNKAIAQTFLTTTTSNIAFVNMFISLKSPLDPGISSIPVTLSLYTGSTPGDPSNTLLGSATTTISSTSLDLAQFAFSSRMSITGATTYNFILRANTQTTNGLIAYGGTLGYGGGALYTSLTDNNDYISSSSQLLPDGNAGYVSVASTDWFLAIASAGTSTQAEFDSVSPGSILKQVITDYQNQGGHVTYTSSTIDESGTTVTYTFNDNTVLDCTKKVLELSPVDWFWYVDQATNDIHLHSNASRPLHELVLGKDFRNLEFEKRAEGIVNTIYFTGGDPGTGTLYVKYTNNDSIALYGVKSQNYIDQRVTVQSTADVIAQSILTSQSQPEVRVTAEIIDSSESSNGYDIESINIGDQVVFRGVDNGTPNLWDEVVWDVDYWDYNLQKINTLTLQITRLEYTPGSLKISCSTIPPDVNKRIEDINRNLNATVTVNNPTDYIVG